MLIVVSGTKMFVYDFNFSNFKSFGFNKTKDTNITESEVIQSVT